MPVFTLPGSRFPVRVQVRSADLVGSANISRRDFLQAGALAVGGALLPVSPLFAQQITTIELGAGAFLLQGAGCNVVALSGPDGGLMVDGGVAANAEALVAAVARATGSNRINTLINTHWHPEQ